MLRIFALVLLLLLLTSISTLTMLTYSSSSTYSEPSVEYTYPLVLKINNPQCRFLLMNFFISAPNPMVIGYDNIVKYRLELVNCVCNLSFSS